MNKVEFDRLPLIVTNHLRSLNCEENWLNCSAEEQRRLLLYAHEQLLDANKLLVKLIVEMEN